MTEVTCWTPTTRPWGVLKASRVKVIVLVSVHALLLTGRVYFAFLLLLTAYDVVILGTLLTVGVSLVTAHFSSSGKGTPVVWHVVRLPATLMLRTFFLWTTTVVALAPFCDLFSQDGVPPMHQVFAEKECASGTHLVLVFVSFPLLLLHVALGAMLRLGDSGMNPVEMELTSGPAATPFVRTTLATGIFAVCSVWLRGLPQTMGVAGTLVFVYTLFLHLRHAPYTHEWVGYLHAGAHAMMLYISLCLLALGSSGEGQAEAITTAMVAGAPAFLALGALAMWYRMRSVHKIALKVLPIATDFLTSGGNPADVGATTKPVDNEADPLDFHHVFPSAVEVELAARCCAIRDQYGNLEGVRTTETAPHICPVPCFGRFPTASSGVPLERTLCRQ